MGKHDTPLNQNNFYLDRDFGKAKVRQDGVKAKTIQINGHVQSNMFRPSEGVQFAQTKQRSTQCLQGRKLRWQLVRAKHQRQRCPDRKVQWQQRQSSAPSSASPRELELVTRLAATTTTSISSSDININPKMASRWHRQR